MSSEPSGLPENGSAATSGRVAWALTNLRGDVRAGELSDETFPSASTMKVAVMIEAFRRCDRGDLEMKQPVVVATSFASGADGSRFEIEPDDLDPELQARAGEEVTLSWLVERMIVRSSNEATNLVLKLVGFQGMARLLPEVGAENTRIERMIDDLAAERAGISNRVTAHDLCRLMTAIARGEAASPESCREMVEILCHQHYREEIPAVLPPGTRIGNKTGWMTGILHDTALIWPEDAEPYCLTVCTEGFAEPERARQRIREISARAWEERRSLHGPEH